MKAILLKEFGSVDNLEITDIPTPRIQQDEVLVEVKAISINPVDLKIRRGAKMVDRAKDPLPMILGWDISGIITETGADVKNFKTGDEVFAMINYPEAGKAYAAFVVAKPGHLAVKPVNVSFSESAAATLSALTAWQALTVYGQVKKGDKVLIHAASGGVGHYAVQMAKHLGAYVIGTSSAANREFVLNLGADEHIDYQSQAVEKLVSDLDFILDPLGGTNTALSLDITKKGGTVVSIVFGFTEDLFNKAKVLGINAHNPQVRPNGDHMKVIAELLNKGVVKSHVSQHFNLAQIRDAHLLLESGRSVGKITLEV